MGCLLSKQAVASDTTANHSHRNPGASIATYRSHPGASLQIRDVLTSEPLGLFETHARPIRQHLRGRCAAANHRPSGDSSKWEEVDITRQSACLLERATHFFELAVAAARRGMAVTVRKKGPVLEKVELPGRPLRVVRALWVRVAEGGSGPASQSSGPAVLCPGPAPVTANSGAPSPGFPALETTPPSSQQRGRVAAGGWRSSWLLCFVSLAGLDIFPKRVSGQRGSCRKGGLGKPQWALRIWGPAAVA